MKKRICIFLGSRAKIRSTSSCQVFFLKGIKITPLKKYQIPQRADYVLLTSKNSLTRGHEFPLLATWVLIGRETAEAARRFKPAQKVILSDSNSQGVIQFFKKLKKRGLIFFPRSARGDSQLPQALRRIGFRLIVRKAYTTKVLSVRRRLLAILKRSQSSPVFVCVSSPSTLQCLRKSLPASERQKLKGLISIGPTTSAALQKLDWPFLQSKGSASLESMFQLVATLPL